MLVRKAILAALAASSAVAVPILDRRFNYGSTPVRGANIGGWLVLEPWITPSLFTPYNGAAVDEWTFCQNVPNAEQLLQQHWSSWATQADFQKLADNGFNMVRIPVGYWAFQKFDDPFIQGAADYLEQAIGWARATGLGVWIDLHGAPGSQNGFDNSGRRTDSPQWTTGDTISQTVGVINEIAQKYAGGSYDDVVIGIELVNEPLMAILPGGRSATADYTSQGFQTVRNYGSMPVIMEDGFDNPSSWNGFISGQGPAGIYIDHHEYQVFTNEEVAYSWTDHVNAVWSNIQTWGTGQDHWLFCGEWTAAMTDCATYLNGYGVGARYDGSYSKDGGSSYVGSCDGLSDISTWSSDMRQATTNYISAQKQAFEQYTQGWIFWNFKTEGSGEWDLFQLIDNGIWPAN